MAVLCVLAFAPRAANRKSRPSDHRAAHSATAATAPVPRSLMGGAAALDDAATPDREVFLASGWAPTKSARLSSTIEFRARSTTQSEI
jgi:hypothetical protein